MEYIFDGRGEERERRERGGEEGWVPTVAMAIITLIPPDGDNSSNSLAQTKSHEDELMRSDEEGCVPVCT